MQNHHFNSALNNAANTPSSGSELEPWLVVLGDDEHGSLAMWRLNNDASPAKALTQSSPDAVAQLTVAMFSDQQRALDYADKCCSGAARIVQVDRTRFLSLMVDCFRQGIRYATLNPGDSTAQSLFVLRDVLSAAKQELSKAN